MFLKPKIYSYRLVVFWGVLFGLVLAFVFFNWERVRHFEAEEAVRSGELEISNARLSLYDGAQLYERFENSFSNFGGGTRELVLRGDLKNVSDRRLFIPTVVNGSGPRVNVYGVELFPTGTRNWSNAMLWIDELEMNQSLSEFSGYYLDPDQTVVFALKISGTGITDSEILNMTLRLNVMDSALMNVGTEEAVLRFSQSGSSNVWFEDRGNLGRPMFVVGSRDAPGGFWTTADGAHSPDEIIQSFVGATHCGWENASFVVTGSPIGAVFDRGSDQNWYVKDPTGVFDNLRDSSNGYSYEWFGEFEVDIELPDSAVFSGFNRGVVELWLNETEQGTAAYIVEGTKVEHWPRVDPPIRCA